MYRLRAKRTTGSNAPADLLFGELAYSDTNKRFYVGRLDGSPATFESDLSLSPIIESISVLDVARASVVEAIAALILNDETQDTAIGSLTNTTSIQSAAFAALSADTQAALATKLEAPAIASFETTTQLNARDTANRDRDNHTGTQPANTITGLAAVATSGAYTDLSGQPTVPYGFTYDQQAEPSSPAAGATWRERTAGGLFVGDWEWSGSVWLSLTIQWDSLEHPPGSNITATTLGSQVTKVNPSIKSILITKVVFNVLMLTTPDAVNYWAVNMSIENINYVNITSTIGTDTNTVLNSAANTVTIKTPNTIVTSNRIRMALTKFATAPTIQRANMQYSFRQVR